MSLRLALFKATDCDTVKFASLLLTTVFVTTSPCALAASVPLHVAAPAGATVVMPEGTWQAIDSAQALTRSGRHLQLPLTELAQSYRFYNGEQLLEVEQTACLRKIGGVFDDCLDGLWESISVQNGSPAWTIEQQDDNWVLDVKFTSDTPFSVASGAHSDPDTPHEWADLRAFAAGSLLFDLKVVSFGNNLNGFEVGLGGAMQPLVTTAIHPTVTGRWQSYSIELKDLIEQGATLSQIEQGFVLKTATGEYEGVHVQIDNVRFKAPIPEPMDWALL